MQEGARTLAREKVHMNQEDCPTMSFGGIPEKEKE